MNAQSRDTVTFLLGSLISLAVLTGLAVRYILMPYLRDHLLNPVQETHHQVTENTGKSPQPTVLDAIHDVQRDVRALSMVMDAHMQWSERYTAATERRFKRIRQLIRMHHPEEGTENDKDSTPGPTI